MRSIGPSERALIVASLVNGSLGTIIGLVAGGVLGAKIGLLAGLLLAVAPIVGRALSIWLTRPDGLARLVMREVAHLAIRAASVVVDRVGAMIGPIARRLKGPAIIVRIIADVAASALAMALAAAWRIIATPLGLANLGALAVIAVNLGGMEFAAPVAFLGLGMLLLVLLVSVNEAEDERAAAGMEKHDDG